MPEQRTTYQQGGDGAKGPYEAGSATVLRSDAGRLPLCDSTVDLIVTSPPYFGLRSYTDGGEHYEAQVGAEATPTEYLDALLACTAEWVRVLRSSGSVWVNLGDKYAGRSGGPQGKTGERSDRTQAATYGDRRPSLLPGVRDKSLIGLPWRYALRCMDELGLILRAEVIWAKPNGLPESVTDRVRRSHEQWFHFTLGPRYYSALDAVREPYAEASLKRYQTPFSPDSGAAPVYTGQLSANPLGKLPGSVWTIPSAPLKGVPAHLGVQHFAAFPPEWPRRLILGWSPHAVCTACSEGRRLVVEQTNQAYADARAEVAADKARRTDRDRALGRNQSTAGGAASLISNQVVRPDLRITGETCGCRDASAPTVPAVVLDPFGGTGTTAMVARALGRSGISVDLSADYCRLAQWRTSDPKQLSKLSVPPTSAQGVLFGEGAA